MSDQDNSSPDGASVPGNRPVERQPADSSTEQSANPFEWQISRVEDDHPDGAIRRIPQPPQHRLESEPTGRVGGGSPPFEQPTVGTRVIPPTAEPYRVQDGQAKRPSAPVLLFAVGLLAAFGGGYLASSVAFADGATETVGVDGGLASTAEESATEDAAGPTSEQSSDEGTADDGAMDGADTTEEPSIETDEDTNDEDPGAAVDDAGVPLDLIESVEPTEENPTGAVRYAVYRNGKAFLRGFARDEGAVDRLVTSFGAVFGPNNVVNEYELNPAAPRWTDAPIYFTDAVLFDVDSAAIRPGFYPLLERTARLLELGPFVSVKVVAMTDATGSAEYNRELAQRRADAVVDYYVEELGIDRFRLESEVLGEARATEEADDDTAATERRVELVVSGVRG